MVRNNSLFILVCCVCSLGRGSGWKIVVGKCTLAKIKDWLDERERAGDEGWRPEVGTHWEWKGICGFHMCAQFGTLGKSNSINEYAW